MKTDREFFETSEQGRHKRRRLFLSFLALLACVLMMTDLILKADTDGTRAFTAVSAEQTTAARWLDP